jgi:3',5'-cyclic AMP phosphodiesterase CpdA
MPSSHDSSPDVLRILHTSDLHFGWPASLAQIDALETRLADGGYDVVAISGDLSQRARAGEFQRAQVLLRIARRASAVITVPGNHDAAWWFAPLGLGDRDRVFAKYRRYIAADLEPVLRVSGATFAGLNTAHGVAWGSITGRPRDVSVMGHVGPAQLERLAGIFAASPPGDARVVVMHHNPMRGQLSDRHGITRPDRTVTAFAGMRVDLVLCGHDHQEAIHRVEHAAGGTVYVTAGTVSERSRGGRPSSLAECGISPTAIEVRPLIWGGETAGFVPGEPRCFAR